MGKFAKRLKRQQKAGREHEYQKAAKARQTANKQVMHATTEQIVQDMVDARDAEANLKIISLVTAHDVLGFGKEKLERFQKKASIHNQCVKEGYVKVSEIDSILDNEVDMVFPETKCRNPNWSKYLADLLCKMVDRVMSCYLIALRDEFGMGRTRLARFYKAVDSNTTKLQKGELGMKDLEVKLAKIMRVKK